ncbi:MULTISPECIES: hypothetical protein [unclassified Streptomyces]|uniref:hypothetical protein n=1 Tax=unclassified Streptomyces TaxID=2593676 RepID=UPI000A3D9FD1|nr:hypothetical protein [Streptomyces sp. PCS3-D2]WKV71052.1 hypothetical protein AW27_005650 [Streptomyces sp. PCS3-D2]
MSATNAAKRLGCAAVGALLAGGLLLAACALPDGRPGTVHDADGRGRTGPAEPGGPHGR